MRSLAEIPALLDALDFGPADALEAQDLDFKEWDGRSRADAAQLVVEMAVCMANGGGGTVIFGVRDRVAGRAKAVLGVPPEIDCNQLRRTVYDQTDPKLVPVFEELAVPEGTGRLIVMQVYPGLPPYTDTAGRAKVRIGKDCMPLTGSMRRSLAVAAGEVDGTAVEVPGDVAGMISPAAMEALRDASRQERAPEDLLRSSDLELLAGLGVLPQGRATVAALLLGGSADALAAHVPHHAWQFLQMQDETTYVDRLDGHEALAVALGRLGDRLSAGNPIMTIPQGFHHFEYRTYPEIALREALLNAFCHRDYMVGGPVMVRLFPERLEISNPGGLVAGISPENILHHAPVARNPMLVGALVKLRLINRSNLGIARMYAALLSEGKEPPLVSDLATLVRVTFLARAVVPAFRAWVAEEAAAGRRLGPDHLLVLRHLFAHGTIDQRQAASVSQRGLAEAQALLREMAERRGYLASDGEAWQLVPALAFRLASEEASSWEAGRQRVFAALQARARAGEPGLSNADLRSLTGLDRFQVNRLVRELAPLGVRLQGAGRGARYVYEGS